MIIRGQFSDFFMSTMLPAIRAKVFETIKQKQPKMDKLFRIETSTRSIEQSSQISGLGLFAGINEAGEVRMDQPVQGFDKTFIHQRYGLGFEVSQDVVEDDKVGLVSRMAVELGTSEVETRETQAASVFNNGFSATSPYAGPDGKALFASDHPLVKAGGTQSNILTAAADLDADSLELALTDWELMKRSNGQQVSLPNPRLLVAPANRWRSHEILKSAMRSDTANNTTNAFRFAEDGPVSDIIVWSKLTDADAWFLVAPPESTGLVWFWRVKPYTRGFFDDRTERGGTIRRYKASWGHEDYIGVYGTPGA